MKKHPWLVRILSVTGACALPYLLIPPAGEYLPGGMLWGLTFLLCWILPPLSAAVAPFWIARAGVPAIAAWPWPIACALILPLWGLAPAPASLIFSFAAALVSAAAGEAWERRVQQSRRKGTAYPKGRRGKR